MPKSAELPIVYNGNCYTEINSANQSLGALLGTGMTFDSWHSPYVRNHTIYPYRGQSLSLGFNGEVPLSWARSIMNADWNTIDGISGFADVTNMQGYGVTHKYTVKIVNNSSLKKNRTFSYFNHIAPAYHIKWETSKGESGHTWLTEKTGTNKCFTAKLNDTGETVITFWVTQMPGSSATAQNAFIIDSGSSNIDISTFR